MTASATPVSKTAPTAVASTVTDSRGPTIGIGLIGYAFMGAAHSQAWRTAPHFFDLPLRPNLTVVAGRDSARVTEAACRLGWADTETDWRQLLHRDDVDIVDICTPGDTHAEIAIAALEAGKHVLCEKPLANTVEEAEAMVRAAEKAAAHGVRSMVGFTYRRVPAIALARQLVAEGRLGTLHHVRAQYLQDWIVDPQRPCRGASTRARPAPVRSATSAPTSSTWPSSSPATPSGGSPVGCTRSSTSVRCPASTPGSPAPPVPPVPAPAPAQVTVDDAATFLAEFRGGAMGVFEATRFANGRKNAIRIEINGSAGSLAFDFEDMNLLHFFDGTEDAGTAGFRGFSSPRTSTPTSLHGGRPATSSATSTASPTRSSTWSTTSPPARTRPRHSPTACGCNASWLRSRPVPTPTPGRRSSHERLRPPTLERQVVLRSCLRRPVRLLRRGILLRLKGERNRHVRDLAAPRGKRA